MPNEDEMDELDECENKKTVTKCKYFHHDPYMTPNNFDLYFNYTNIPSNIYVDGGHDLLKRLQKTLPLSKVLHLNLETKSSPQNNQINLYTYTRIRYKKKSNGNETTVMKEIR